MKVIKVSNEIYEKLVKLSEDSDIPMSKLATMLIDKGFQYAEIKEETVTRKIIKFKD